MNLWEKASNYKRGVTLLAEWLGERGAPVEQAVAQKRAHVCLGCAENRDGWQLAESVAAAIREQVELKNELQLRVQGEKSLHTCAQCLCPLRTKIWVPIELVRKHWMPGEKEKLKQAKPDCWQLTEL